MTRQLRIGAAKHYLQTTNEHFDKAVQNPVQQAHATHRIAWQVKPSMPGFSGDCDTLQSSAKVISSRGGTRTRTPFTDPGF